MHHIRVQDFLKRQRNAQMEIGFRSLGWREVITEYKDRNQGNWIDK